MKHKVIAGITTKDEDWIIEKPLNALTNFCEKIIVYDDGSTDDTEKICRSYNKVEWHVRPKHNPLDREEAKQRLELVNILDTYEPEYILLLDADEVPTPSIVDFLESIDTSIGLWKSRMINLWDNDTMYRVDGYVNRYGQNINWDPFSANAWVKYPLMKYDSSISYHPTPQNPAGPVREQENFYIIHYGKISPTFLNGEKNEFYAKIEEKDGRGDFDSLLSRHRESNRVDTLITKPIDKSWIWDKH